MSRTAFRLLMTVALLLAPSVAFAHPGHGEGGSLLAGFIHPFSGIDHLLAMTAVGLFAANLGGRALWAVPATFVAMMALGGVFGAAGVTPPVLAARALVGIFAIFHGHAHGTEMPVGGSGVVYGIGFMVATTLLHGFGITLGLAIRWFDDVPRRRAMQACGVAIALIGAGLTIGLV